MVDFEYCAPASVAEAVALLAADPGARTLAGGTDLIVQARSGRIAPNRIVDIKRIDGLGHIRRTADGGFAIGAAVPCSALGDDAALAAAWPGVVEAAQLIGSTQVRNRATIAGNLCNGSPAADSVPALIAAGARCVIASPDGSRREIAAEDLPAGPGRNTLANGELLVEILLPPAAATSADAYLRMTPRTEMDIAVAGAGVSLALDADGRITAARVALGAVAPTALLVPPAAAAVIGTRLEADALDALAAAARTAARPISDKRGTAAYRVAMAGTLARRAATIAYERARSRA